MTSAAADVISVPGVIVVMQKTIFYFINLYIDQMNKYNGTTHSAHNHERYKNRRALYYRFDYGITINNKYKFSIT